MNVSIRKTVRTEEALDLAQHGLSVFPIKSRGKIPAVESWKQYQTTKATSDEVAGWYGNGHDYNIAVATGAVSGIVVLDVDNPTLLTEEVPRTPTVKTNRGYHYYFKHPGFEVRNLKLECGEVQATGRYVVTPPSVHPSGGSYEWLVGLDEAPLADLAEWLLDRLMEGESTPLKAEAIGAANDNSHTTAYGKAWFEDVEKLAHASAGSRNNLLNEVACKAGSLVEGGQLNEFEARKAMVQACRTNGLASDDGQPSVTKTMVSGIAKGKQSPRYPIDLTPDVETSDPVGKSKFQYKRASEFKSEVVPWLWEPVLIKGAVSFIAGEGGLGKSTVAVDIAARISNGDCTPCKKGNFDKGTVIYLTDENDPNYTLRPRLEACGANLDNIIIPELVTDEQGERSFNLERDVQAMEDMLLEVGGVSLIIIDPFNAYLGKNDLNDMGKMRGLISPYMSLAQKYRMSILFIHHFNKSTGKASGRMSGSTALRNAARAVFHVERDPDQENFPSRRVMVSDKNNLGNDRIGFGFSINAKEVANGVTATYLDWEPEAFAKSSDEVMLEALEAGGRALKEAKEFLRVHLSDGPMLFSELKLASEDYGIKPTTLNDAKNALGVFIVQDQKDKRKSWWSLTQQPF